MSNSNGYGPPPYRPPPAPGYGPPPQTQQQHPMQPYGYGSPMQPQQHPQHQYQQPYHHPVQMQMQPYGQPQQVVNVVQQNVMVKAPFNHGIHILLDVITCGAWIPVHLICLVAH